MRLIEYEFFMKKILSYSGCRKMTRSSEPTYRRVAVIGGGPGGLAMAKALAIEPATFDRLALFERRDKIGGVWYYSEKKKIARPSVPSCHRNSKDVFEDVANEERPFLSSMYDNLETNLPGKMMEYNNVHFANQSKPFLNRHEVLQYVQEYAQTIPSSVQRLLNSNVVELRKDQGVWNLKYEDMKTKEFKTDHFDAVVVANGHFNVPFIPDVEGLEEWSKKDPSSITHARYFVRDTDYKDKNVLVIGNKSSGSDISMQLSVSAKKVFVSSSEKEAIDNHNVTHIGIVKKYDYENGRSVETVDGDIINSIDAVIFCTGYLYDVPFLKTYENILGDGRQIYDLYKQIFYLYDPSLAFIGLPKDVVPMPLSESQAAIVARVYSGRLKLPSVEEMKGDYEKELQERGKGTSFHKLPFPLDGNYCRELQKIIDDANIGTVGLRAPIWDDAKMDLRSKVFQLKQREWKKWLSILIS